VSAAVRRKAATLQDDLDQISAMALPELRGFWNARWGDVPGYRARDHLLRATAWRLQADVHGGLPGRLTRELADIGQKFANDRGFNPGPSIVLKPGSSLIREWGGKRHEVAVVADGFAYEGEHYASLSKVATRITGTKWNGPVFFGVKPRKAPGRAVTT
jgi:hypothetical protein